MNRIKPLSKLAFIGLGALGKPMSDLLLNRGFDLKLYNRDKTFNNGNNRYSFNNSETVTGYDGLLICVTDDAAVESVLFGENPLSECLKTDSFVIDFSTINPAKSISLHERLKRKKIFYVDCPVSGGTEGAKTGNLSLFVGASKNDCAHFEDIFHVVGKSINYFDVIGNGQKVKALNQILVAGTYAAVAEAVALGKLLNLPMDLVVNSLKLGAANSWPLENRSNSMLKDDHPLGFKLGLHHKDLCIAVDLAKSINVSLPITSKVKEIESELMDRGYSDLDISVLHRYIYKNNL